MDEGSYVQTAHVVRLVGLLNERLFICVLLMTTAVGCGCCLRVGQVENEVAIMAAVRAI
jgi:hypothetical protein